MAGRRGTLKLTAARRVPPLMPKVRLEIAVSDHEVEPTIEAIRASARTGQIGDGKIFVLPIERAMRIRTAETGDEAL